MFCDHYALIFSLVINIPYLNFFLFFQKKEFQKSRTKIQNSHVHFQIGQERLENEKIRKFL